MARPLRKRLEFPLGGLDKSTGYQNQKPYTTAKVNNFWPYQDAPTPATGRARGGTRLGVAAYGSSLGAQPCNWCPATWVASNVTYRGVAVATDEGVFVDVGSGWTEVITKASAVGTDFTSCAVYNNDLYYAMFSEVAEVRTLTNPGSGAGTAVNAAWSEGFEETPGSGTNGGTPPTNCGLVSVHMNRLVFAGDEANPQVLYMSRAGYPKDWDYAKTDTGAAWATSGGQSAQIGEPITALIAHTDNCLIVGCTDSMYVVSGNPTSSGSIYKLSNDIGPISQAAWCKTANGWTYFLTRDGLYRIPPGCPSSAPEQVSRKNLPEELVAVDPGTSGTYASIGYDARWRGIHIYVNQSGPANTYYFYDLENGGFWPMTFSQTFRLAVNHKIAAASTESGLLAIDSDGAAYQFTTGSSEDISSELAYGPILLEPEGLTGRLNEVIAVLAENSTAVSWKVYVGNSAAEAYARLNADDPQFTGVAWAVEATWEDGRDRLLQYAQNPLIAGQCCYIKIYATGTTARISVEEIELSTVPNGPRRVM